MRGEKVLVRAYGDRPLVRVIWDWDPREDVVYITDEDGLVKLLSGDDGPLPIGFHRDDVFLFDIQGVKAVQQEYATGGQVNWSHLHQWGSQ